MRVVFSLILLFSSCCIADAQNVNRTWGWSKHAHGAGGKDILQVKVDIYGNVYSLMLFYGLFVYGSNSYNSIIGNTALIKHDRYGNVIYTKIYPLEISALAVDNDENVYIAGGDLIIRLGSNGGEYWRKNLGNVAGITSRIEDMVVDNDQNIIVVGDFLGQAFNWGGIPLYANNSSIHVIVSKLNPSGAVIWADCSKNGQDGFRSKAAVDGDNNIYLLGETNAGISFDGATYAPNCNSTCLYLAKFDSAGKHAWIKNVTGTGHNNIHDGRGIVVDDSSYVYVGGYPDGSSTVARYDTSGQQHWIVKNLPLDLFGLAVDNNGNSYISGTAYINWGGSTWEQQVRQIKPDGRGGTIWRLNRTSFARNIACDKSNNLYIAGVFNDSVQLGDTTHIAKNAPGGDVFLAQLAAQKLVTVDSYDRRGYCITDTITTYFSHVDTAFKPGNSFVFELSSGTGSFKQPTQLGTYTTTALADSFKFVPPSSITAGAKYRVRIRSTNPVYYATADSVIAIDTLPPQPAITVSGQRLSTKEVTGTLQWYRNGNLLAGATDTVYVPANSGDYTVTHTTQNGCVVSSNVTNFWAVGIGETSKYDIMVFPNPMTNYVIVQNLPHESWVFITDVTGRTLYRTNRIANNMSIPTNELIPGIYFLIIKLHDGTELQYKLSK